MEKPQKTIMNYLNVDEMMKFKEQRRFKTFKDKGHFYFDKIWIEHKLFNREEAYKWLASMLGVNEPEAHFGVMSNELCDQAIYLCQQLLNDLRRNDLDWGDEPITPFYILN